MNPENFAMSSYQFVNSLASCYPQSQLNQQQNHPVANNNNNNSGPTPTGNPQTPNSEYFPASAYTPNLYPSTPQAHYANQAYNLGGQQNTTDMVDYTQLQPQRLLLPNQQQQQSAQAPLNTASCKYAGDTASGNNNTSISSPQDLTTAREISPKLSPSSVVDSVQRSLNKTSSSAVSSTNPANNHSSGIGNAPGHTTVPLPLPMHSPAGGDSDTSSESGNEAGGSSQNSSGKKGTPPQIYPWMKRVHLGQSKSKIDLVTLKFLIKILALLARKCHFKEN